MRQVTASASTAEQQDSRPPNAQVMRASALRLLSQDAEPPAADELATLTMMLREHMELLIPEVAVIAGRLPEDNIPRYCALACVGEARGKLRVGPGPGAGGDVEYTRKLARSLNALCDHWENLGGARPGAGQ
ncbi:DUF6415 family natural product biosynthesis protein [Streptomyces turgidiscabies]|uniref:Uncharacterized protein n=1 Tax=Streptomyces turgidiscabies TaxID=85558 RepID=A0ABU0RS16_9ACTN|nr:DUF6415 family natural product biosynthesis protein [Streptomyces turgidiscabies]MDQ0934769.1 hypothetical protein [Streptomyces turgidiscabies]